MVAELDTIKNVPLMPLGADFTQGKAAKLIDSFEMVRKYVTTTIAADGCGEPGRAENTGTPCFGRVAELGVARVDGQPCLVADLADVPDPIASMIRERRYSGIALETRDAENPIDGLPTIIAERLSGPALVRVTFTGPALPCVRTLADIQHLFNDGRNRTMCRVTTTSKFADVIRRRVKLRGPIAESTPPTLKRFSDTPADAKGKPSLVKRADVIAALADYGVDPAVLTDAVPDAFLCESLRVLQQINPTGPEDNRSSHGPPAASNETPNTQFAERQKVKAAVEKYVDANPRIFEVTRRNPASIVRTFADMQARKPNYTAAEFIGELGIG